MTHSTSEFSWVVLDVGNARIPTKRIVDDEHVVEARRSKDCLLLVWNADFDDLTPPEEASDRLFTELGEDLLARHGDTQGILVAPATDEEPPTGTYESVVKKLGKAGRFFANPAKEPGGRVSAVERDEIPLPDPPRSKMVELYVMSPGRAKSALALTSSPTRVVCLERTTTLAPADVSAFYQPLLRAAGFETKRRVWSDGSAEQLVGQSSGHQAIVHAERTANSFSRSFVRVAWITKS